MNEKIATLSQRLQQVLTERNLKQADLVKITGLRKQQINQYVNGEFTAKPEKLFMIAKALDVSDQWLAGYDVSIERIVDEPFDRWESTFNPNGVLAREVTDKETQMKIIGKNIKTRREELDMTQDELAAKLGYTHRSAINKIELGINNFPMSKIKDFAAALQTSTDRLLGEITDEPAASKAYYTVKKLLTDNLRGGRGKIPNFPSLRVISWIA